MFAVTFYFVKPAPPKKLVLAMATDEGGFRYFARKYQEVLAKHGVTLELRPTQGSVTSVELLADDERRAWTWRSFRAARRAGRRREDVVSLGSLSYVPAVGLLPGRAHRRRARPAGQAHRGGARGERHARARA